MRVLGAVCDERACVRWDDWLLQHAPARVRDERGAEALNGARVARRTGVPEHLPPQGDDHAHILPSTTPRLERSGAELGEPRAL